MPDPAIIDLKAALDQIVARAAGPELPGRSAQESGRGIS
jgi:hypothetical protein